MYQALHLVRETGLPAQVEYVIHLSHTLSGKDTLSAVYGLVDFGLLGLRQNILDVFSDEQHAGKFGRPSGDRAVLAGADLYDTAFVSNKPRSGSATFMLW